jgi:hypothetical protein
MTEWMLRGPAINICNCDFSCPCQFNALPTNGDCRASGIMHIDEGHHGGVKLDGLNWAMAAAWPGPIHMGRGEMQRIVDARATPEQREALLRILSGEDSEPGATYLQVFSAMCEKFHAPLFAPISFAMDMNSCEGRVSIPGILEATTTAIRNPVTGKAHHARVSLRAGFEYTEAEFCSGTVTSPGPVRLANNGTHAHLCTIHITGKGVVH